MYTRTHTHTLSSIRDGSTSFVPLDDGNMSDDDDGRGGVKAGSKLTTEAK